METEILVKQCLKLLRENSSIDTIADIGTGSGIIPISLAQKSDRPLKVFATDMSLDVLDLARENTQKIFNPQSLIDNTPKKTSFESIQFLQGDLLQPLIQYF